MLDYNNGKIMEKVKEIPLYGDYDVVVAGGGVAGFGAAVAAGRRGCKVLLIELTHNFSPNVVFAIHSWLLLPAS